MIVQLQYQLVLTAIEEYWDAHHRAPTIVQVTSITGLIYSVVRDVITAFDSVLIDDIVIDSERETQETPIVNINEYEGD